MPLCNHAVARKGDDIFSLAVDGGKDVISRLCSKVIV